MINTQSKKKLFATITITLLIASALLSIAPLAQAAPTGTATPNNGPVGTVTTIAGTGASPGGFVELFWLTLAGAKLNETWADGTGNFSCKVTIPAGTVGAKSIIARDDSTGTTGGVTFTIAPEITVTPLSGIPGDVITVTGTGFAATSAITLDLNSTDVTPAPAPVTSALGSFTGTFTIPALYAYGNNTVTATDAGSNTDDIDFVVGATLTLNPVKGASGAVVAVSGRGFDVGPNPVVITVGGIVAKQVTPITTTATGTFAGEIIIPTLTVGAGIVVNASDSTEIAYALFEVDATTVVTVDPVSGAPSSTATVSGTGFTQIAGTAVTVIRYIDSWNIHH